ncbi:hypothetical protein BHE74_00007622 [Ensete ventricosum]|nr:hypothetical protein BHE74_00007622 [Ensete ventricosum]
MIGARHLCCSLLTADPETFKISEVARAGNRVRGTRIWPFESPVISRITRLMEDEHPSSQRDFYTSPYPRPVYSVSIPVSPSMARRKPGRDAASDPAARPAAALQRGGGRGYCSRRRQAGPPNSCGLRLADS